MWVRNLTNSNTFPRTICQYSGFFPINLFKLVKLQCYFDGRTIDEFDPLYVVDVTPDDRLVAIIQINTPLGRSQPILTIWLVPFEAKIARFITAIPNHQKR